MTKDEIMKMNEKNINNEKEMDLSIDEKNGGSGFLTIVVLLIIGFGLYSFFSIGNQQIKEQAKTTQEFKYDKKAGYYILRYCRQMQEAGYYQETLLESSSERLQQCVDQNSRAWLLAKGQGPIVDEIKKGYYE